MPGELVRLMPHSRIPILRVCNPTLGQVAQIGQRRGPARLVEHGEKAVARPKHKGGPTVRALERSTFIAGRFVKLLLVGLYVIESVGWAELFRLQGKRTQRRRRAVRPPPFGQRRVAIADLARLELVVARPPTATRPVTVGIFGRSALLDRYERQMQVAAGRWRRGGEHVRRGGVGSLELVEAEFG